MHWIYHSGGLEAIDLFGLGTFTLLGFFPLLVWLLAWKGWALWLAARRGEKIWFIILLAVNTLGLLEIFYIFAVAKMSDTKPISIEEDASNVASSIKTKFGSEKDRTI